MKNNNQALHNSCYVLISDDAYLAHHSNLEPAELYTVDIKGNIYIALFASRTEANKAMTQRGDRAHVFKVESLLHPMALALLHQLSTMNIQCALFENNVCVGLGHYFNLDKQACSL